MGRVVHTSICKIIRHVQEYILQTNAGLLSALLLIKYSTKIACDGQRCLRSCHLVSVNLAKNVIDNKDSNAPGVELSTCLHVPLTIPSVMDMKDYNRDDDKRYNTRIVL
jgi:hypothetical protein